MRSELSNTPPIWWDDFISARSFGTYRGHRQYAEALRQTHRYLPRYFFVAEGDRPIAAMLAIEYKDFLGRRKWRAHSMVFDESIGDERAAEAVGQMKAIVHLSLHKYGVHSLNVESQEDRHVIVHRAFPEAGRLFMARKWIDEPYEKLRDEYAKDIRTYLNKADRLGVRVERRRSIESIREDFYPIYCHWSKYRHGTPVQPLSLFEHLFRFFGENAVLYVALYEGAVIGAFLGFVSGRTLSIAYVSYLLTHTRHEPYAALYDAFIRHAAEHALKYFEADTVTNPKKAGNLLKYRFDLLPIIRFIFTADGSTHPFPKERRSFVSNIWRTLVPMALANRSGPYLRKHLGK